MDARRLQRSVDVRSTSGERGSQPETETRGSGSAGLQRKTGAGTAPDGLASSNKGILLDFGKLRITPACLLAGESDKTSARYQLSGDNGVGARDAASRESSPSPSAAAALSPVEMRGPMPCGLSMPYHGESAAPLIQPVHNDGDTTVTKQPSADLLARLQRRSHRDRSDSIASADGAADGGSGSGSGARWNGSVTPASTGRSPYRGRSRSTKASSSAVQATAGAVPTARLSVNTSEEAITSPLHSAGTSEGVGGGRGYVRYPSFLLSGDAALLTSAGADFDDDEGDDVSTGSGRYLHSHRSVGGEGSSVAGWSTPGGCGSSGWGSAVQSPFHSPGRFRMGSASVAASALGGASGSAVTGSGVGSAPTSAASTPSRPPRHQRIGSCGGSANGSIGGRSILGAGASDVIDGTSAAAAASDMCTTIAGSGAGAVPLSPLTIQARMQQAKAKREQMIEAVRSQLKAAEAARVSKVTLTQLEQRRNSIHGRLEAVRMVDAAAQRREAVLEQKKAGAKAHVDKVAKTSSKVKAARRLQSWFRFRRLLLLGERRDAEEVAAASKVVESAAAEAQRDADTSAAASVTKGAATPTTSTTAVAAPKPTAAAAAAANAASEAPLPPPPGSLIPAAIAKGLQSKVLPLLASSPAQKCLAVVYSLLAGTPTLDDGRKLNGVDSVTVEAEEAAEHQSHGPVVATPVATGAAEEEATAATVSNAGPTSSTAASGGAATAGASSGGGCPYPDFETCATAIQQRAAVAAAQALAQLVMRAYQTAEGAGMLPPSAAPTGGCSDASNAAAADAMEDGASASTDVAGHLRPSVARSGRTLLAALMIAYFPAEILTAGSGAGADHGAEATAAVAAGTSSSNGGGAGPSARKLARDEQLLTSARRMLATLHALCETSILDQSVVSGAGTTSGRGAHFGLNDCRLDRNLDTSPHLTSELLSALRSLPPPAAYTTPSSAAGAADASTPTAIAPASADGAAADSSAAPAAASATTTKPSRPAWDSDLRAQRLHALWSFNAAWCAYMDAFMIWKSGDGMALAQGLARPYRQLLAKQAQLHQEADTSIGRGDSGLEELREGTGAHMALLEGQLVTLLGAKRAEQWKADQRASYKAELERDRRLGFATASTAAAPSSSAASTPTAGAGVTTAGAGIAVAPSFRRGSFSSSAGGPRTPLAGTAASTGASPGGERAAAVAIAGAPTPPRGAVAAPQMALYRAVMSNEVLVHELLLDPTFRLPDPPQPDDIGFTGEEEEEEIEEVTAVASTAEPAPASGSSGEEGFSLGGPALPAAASSATDVGRSRASSISSRPTVVTSANGSSSTSTAPLTSGMPLSPIVKAAASPAPASPDITRLAARISAGTAGASVKSSPLLTPLAPAAAAAAVSSVTSAGAGAAPSLSIRALSASATTSGAATALVKRPVRRLRYKGGIKFTGDPAQMKMNPAFWDAALRAAQEQADAAAERGDSLSAPPPSQGRATTTGTSGAADEEEEEEGTIFSSGHPAIDMVLSGLASCREAIASLVPNRADLHADMRARVDLDLFRQMLQQRAFSHGDWIALLRYIAGLVGEFEAPARAEGTQAWLAEAEVHVRRIATRRAEAKAAAGLAKRAAAGGTPILTPALTIMTSLTSSPAAAAMTSGGTGSGASTPVAAARVQVRAASGASTPLGSSAAAASTSSLPPPVVDDDLSSLLPRFFAWVHYKVALIWLDISNAQLASLVPYLQTNGRGTEYERQRFEAAREAGRVGVEGTRAWLAEAVRVASAHQLQLLQTTASDNGASAQSTVASLPLTSDYKIARLSVLRDGFVLLLGYDQPLTVVASVAAQSRPPDGVVRLRYSAPPPDTPVAGGSAAIGSGPSPQAGASAPSAAAAVSGFSSFLYPETLHLDAKRLTDVQNVVQRTALVATLSALVTQVAATTPLLTAVAPAITQSHPGLGQPQATVTSASDVEGQVRDWLMDDSLRLEDLTAGAVAAADALCRKGGRVPLLVPNNITTSSAATVAATDTTTTQQQQLQQLQQLAAVRDVAARLTTTLRSAVAKTVSTAHPLYTTYQKRVLEVLRRKLTRAVQDALPPGVDSRHAHEYPAWGSFLDEAGAPMPGPLAAAVPACCAADILKAATDLSRLTRHNDGVFESLYRQLLAELGGAGPQ